MTVTTMTVCTGCKFPKEIVYTDELEQGYCADCVGMAEIPASAKVLAFLLATIPFQIGDRVECRVRDVFEGVGTVDAIYFDIEHAATPVYPTFHVALDGKVPTENESPWADLYTENCLTKVEQ